MGKVAFSVVTILLLGAFASHLFLITALPPTTKTFEVAARRFEYEPHIIRVNKGDHVIITLAPVNVIHVYDPDGKKEL